MYHEYGLFPDHCQSNKHSFLCLSGTVSSKTLSLQLRSAGGWVFKGKDLRKGKDFFF